MENEELIEQDQLPEEGNMVEEEQFVDANNTLEPLIIETKGKWQPFEAMTGETFEVGKTYKIHINGQCQFMISKNKPTFGFGTNEIMYTKDNDNTLWIKTGG